LTTSDIDRHQKQHDGFVGHNVVSGVGRSHKLLDHHFWFEVLYQAATKVMLSGICSIRKDGEILYLFCRFSFFYYTHLFDVEMV
jgi:hypothetical protein